MMKIGLVASKQFKESLHRLMNQPKVPVKTCFKLRGIVKIINDELEKYTGVRDQIAKEFSSKDENGNPIEEVVGTQLTTKLDMTKMIPFFRKIKELDDLDIKIPSLKMSELGDEKHLTLVPEDYYQLQFLKE